MANQTLLQFTTKTLVEDADWVFVWDTAGAISKKVSRNSLLNSGTLTTSAPVTISQTWNDAAVAFTAFKVNATSTNSATGSLLLDLQVGTVSQLNVTKAGVLFLTNSTTSGGIDFNGFGFMSAFNWQMRNGNGYIGLGATATEADTRLYRDTNNTLALRNGAAAQTFNVYNTYTDTSNYSRLRLQTGSGFVQINAEGAGTGLQNSLYFNAGSTSNNGIISFRTKDVERWNVASAGHLLAGIDNQNDIGASGANRPRNLYVVNAYPSNIQLQNAEANFGWITRGGIYAPSNGVVRLSDSTNADFSRLQLGGTTDSFPAIARDGAGIKFTGAAAGSTSWVKVPPVAVSALPLAATAGVGARAFVNDATAPVFGSAVTGGGSVPVPVYSTGSAWNVG